MLHKSNMNDGAVGFEPPACEPGPVGGMMAKWVKLNRRDGSSLC